MKGDLTAKNTAAAGPAKAAISEVAAEVAAITLEEEPPEGGRPLLLLLPVALKLQKQRLYQEQ